jgi:hypothetical protein
MTAPPGLELPKPGLVCRLHKSLYGLKQSSRQWNATLTQTLTSIGFKRSKADYSLFTRQGKSTFIAILVYVDDLIIARDDLVQIQDIKHLLDQHFSIRTLDNSNTSLAWR